MKHKVREKNRDYVADDECRHYWIIEVANGPKSRGVCRYCGASRDFLNSIPDINPPKRRSNPLDLPEISEVEVGEDSKS
jgi:hypothetical protein